MRSSSRTNLERQEAEIDKFREKNPDAVTVLPTGYLSSHHARYSKNAQKIIQAMVFTGKANRSSTGLNPEQFKKAIKEIQKDTNNSLVMVKHKDEIIAVKRK